MQSGPPIDGFVASAFCGSLYLYIRSRPGRSELIPTGVVALLMMSLLGGDSFGWRAIFVLGAAWAGVALVVTVLAPLFDRTQVAARQRVLIRMSVPFLAVGASAVGLKLSAVGLAATRDYDLYAADASFGFEPAFAVARLVSTTPLVSALLDICYENLPLIVVIVYERLEQRARADAVRLVATLGFIGVVGFCAYRLVPGAGTMAVFGPDFPNHPPTLASVARIQTPDPSLPRNCLPSLHAAWILAVWWACPPTRLRWLVGAAVVLTMVATMTGGGHYLVDLVVAVPFVTAIDLAIGRRYTAAAAMACLVLIWVVVIRAELLLNVGPLGAWTASLATIASSVVVRRRATAEYLPAPQ